MIYLVNAIFYLLFWGVWSTKDFTNDLIRFFLLTMCVVNMIMAMHHFGYIIKLS